MSSVDVIGSSPIDVLAHCARPADIDASTRVRAGEPPWPSPPRGPSRRSRRRSTRPRSPRRGVPVVQATSGTAPATPTALACAVLIATNGSSRRAVCFAAVASTRASRAFWSAATRAIKRSSEGSGSGCGLMPTPRARSSSRCPRAAPPRPAATATVAAPVPRSARRLITTAGYRLTAFTGAPQVG